MGGIDLAWKTVATSSIADNLNAPIRHGVTEGSRCFEVDWVPAKLHECVAVGIGVGASHVRGPVAPGVLVGSPHTCDISGGSRRVDVVVSSSSTPVAGVWDSKLSVAFYTGRDKHRLVTR